MANSACRTSRLIRKADGSITAQAIPCGTRQWIPKAGAMPWANPSPELANAMPESNAACDIRSRADRERPFSTASAIAGTASRSPAPPGPGDRLGLPRDVAFDELRDRVHAAGRGHFRRHADRKLRIDQGDPRQDAIVAKTFLERRIVRRNDRVAGRLRAGPGRGGHGQHGQRRVDDLQPPADIFQVVSHRGALPVRGDDGRRLGQVDGRPPADSQEKTSPIGVGAAKFPGHAIDIVDLGLVENRLDERRLDALAKSNSRISPSTSAATATAGPKGSSPGGRACGRAGPLRGGAPSRKRFSAVRQNHRKCVSFIIRKILGRPDRR